MQERNSFSHDTIYTTEIEPSNKYALISVYNKDNIVWFSRQLQDLGYNIISTGGTANVLEDNGLNVTPIEEITGFPEIFDGRIKSISTQTTGGILFDRTNSQHVEEAEKYNIRQIDIVVSNFYPFEEIIKKPDVTLDEVIKNIDIGGPTMIRAAAKNFLNTLVVVDPNDYADVVAYLKSNEKNNLFQQKLAARAFAHQHEYDRIIAQYFWNDYIKRNTTS